MPAKKQNVTTSEIKPTQTTRIFDVARPGALPPADATTRPVIVTKRVIMQDPMMAPQGSKDALLSETSGDSRRKPLQKIVLRPLIGSESGTSAIQPSADVAPRKTILSVADHDDVRDDDADGVFEPSAADVSPDTTTSQTNAPTGFPMPIATKAKKKTAPANSEIIPSAEADAAASTLAPASPDYTNTAQPASVDGVTGQESSETIGGLDGEKKQAAQLEADAKTQDELDTLVSDKTYFLPINSVVERRSRHVFIFGTILILLLAALWLNIALDAGFLSIPGIKPLTHLFSN